MNSILEHSFRSFEPRTQSLNEAALCLVDLYLSLSGRKELRAIDLGKILHLPRARRPLEFEDVTREGDLCIRLHLEGPSIDRLAALLSYRPKIDEVPLGIKTCLLTDFASGRRQHVLALGWLAFGYAPGAHIFRFPERSAGMYQQDFELSRSSLVN